MISTPERHVALLPSPGPYSQLGERISYDASEQMLGGFESERLHVLRYLKSTLPKWRSFQLFFPFVPFISFNILKAVSSVVDPNQA